MTTLREQWLSAMADAAYTPTAAHNGSCYLPNLGVVAFSGPDAGDFLQGYLTCDTATLTPDRLQPWALCNLQGRVVANGWCTIGEHDAIELIVDRSLGSTLVAFFKPYLMFSKTELTSRMDAVLLFGSLDGPISGAFAVGENQHLRAVVDLPTAVAIHDPNAQPNSWCAQLIKSGICLLSANTSATFLPQMLGLEEIGAVSFDKGCYLGQEVVARAQHRGSVKRRLQQLHWQGSALQPGDSLLTGNGTKAGIIVNAVATQTGGGIALAVVAKDADYPLTLSEQGQELPTGEQRDTVLNPVG